MVKKICDFLIAFILICLFFLSLALFVPNFIGYKSFAVVSGSMEPNIHVGSIVYSKPVEFDQLKKGDIISFKLSEDTMVTHRIYEVDKVNRTFITKGDANENIDGQKVSFDNVVGKVQFIIPFIGYISIYMKTPLGIAAVCFIIGIMIILNYLPDLITKDNNDE